jgi:magnesium transporter
MRVAIAIVPEVRELLRDDPAQLRELLEEIHDEDLADLLKLLGDQEAMLLLEQLGTETAADAFERLDEDEQAELVERFGTERLADIVSEMAPDERTDLLSALPEPVGGKLLETIRPQAAAEVAELSRYAEDTAGGLMTTEYVAVAPDFTVTDVIERIRAQGGEAETVYYVYCLDPKGKLLGVASLRDLLLAEPRAVMRDVMTENVYTVGPETDQEEVARTLNKYDFVALPVTDVRGKLLGVITVDDVLDVLVAEQTEDVQKLAAVGPIEERYFRTSFWTFLNKRAPWLAILFVGEFLTGAVMRRYDPVIEAVSELAHYVPLLISTGGNSGAQSATLIIRGLATGDIGLGDWWRVLGRELGQGLVLGLLLAALGMARVWWTGDAGWMALAIGLAVVCIVLMGCTVGAMLPLLLRRIGLDPATSSTPFVATLVDVLGILLYLSIAKAVMARVLAATL